VDNFYISQSEKDFLGGGRRGREAGGALSGDIVIAMRFGFYISNSLQKTTLKPDHQCR
jgi:hypothetical protein